MDLLLNKYNDDIQTLADNIQQLETWKCEKRFDTLTRQEKNRVEYKKPHSDLQKVIKASRFTCIESIQALINSSNLDDETKKSLCQSANYMTMFEYEPTTVTFRAIGEGAMKLFEDPSTYDSRKSYQNQKDKQGRNAKRHVANYRSGVANIALSLCVENLNNNPSDRSRAIIDFFQTKSKDGAAEAKVRADKCDECNQQHQKQRKKKKAEQQLNNEKGMRLLNLMVLIEHDGNGNRKLVDCNVTGDQLELTEINLGSKKRKMK